MRLKILLVILGSLLLAPGLYFVTNKLKPQPEKQGSVAAVVENKTATKSAELKQEEKNEEPKQSEEVKGAKTKTNPPISYQPIQPVVDPNQELNKIQSLSQNSAIETQFPIKKPKPEEPKDCTPITQLGSGNPSVTVTIYPCANIKQDQPLINP